MCGERASEIEKGVPVILLVKMLRGLVQNREPVQRQGKNCQGLHSGLIPELGKGLGATQVLSSWRHCQT